MAVAIDRRDPRQLRELRPAEIGGNTDKYSWHQTNWEIHCTVPVDAETTRFDIECSIKRRHLLLSVFEEVIFNGSLFDNIDPEESSWILEKNQKTFPPRLEVVIFLKKELESQGRNHWTCVVDGHPKIDVDWLGPPIKAVHPKDWDTLLLIQECSRDKAVPFCNMRDPLATRG
ncbi:unnamed protein product [Effrenium voratum]|nr:unnamed protein product [Effrenium voratum]